MEEKTYTITLADGTIIENLRLNGDNFISTVEITADIFRGNCTTVIISDGETEEVFNDMELVQIVAYGEEYWFVMRQISESESMAAKLRADLDYIAMMTDIDLEAV